MEDCESILKFMAEDLQPKKVRLIDLNPYIVCRLCGGYLIDATTITECLHPFCHSCLLKHLDFSNRCPTCNVIIHETNPLYNIRPDRTLQDIIYKLLPALEEDEKKREKTFYEERGIEYPLRPPTPPPPPPKPIRKPLAQKSTNQEPSYEDSQVSLLLEFSGTNPGVASQIKPLKKKYVRVSNQATVGHVQKFLLKKLELDSDTFQVDVLCNDEVIDRGLTLQTVEEILAQKVDGLIVLHYRVGKYSPVSGDHTRDF
ncbi:polycomb group RING finger protein 6-like [Branchiostoma floridae]|uniref:Polycomb group RING finger protein 6 n=1 Tax=Branchiostoma floridae TaxID=7739 RepID=C3ZTD4_BRAFL|nr:polycomb group RING finger protein 6-like [Branchiostoma floridae]|eukprot:XP_002588170.1 hypothetical protein BRAFLDRAFT_118878 [Branchiostoma floridae]